MNWFSPWGTKRERRHKTLVQMIYIYTMGDFKLAKGGIKNTIFFVFLKFLIVFVTWDYITLF